MWVAKIRCMHDCMIGNRCKKFNLTAKSYELGKYKDGKTQTTSSMHQLFGKQENINKFVKDFKKEKDIIYSEFKNNTLFVVDKKKETPVTKFDKNIFMASPVAVDSKGYEHWEIGSYKREEINKFITDLEAICFELKIIHIKEIFAENIFFPKLMPNLTELQKQAIELAIKEGYYKVPKKTSLRQLAKIMNISLATYQRHLQVAESKLIPDIFSNLQ
jgi:predicted DNA binding protein